MYPIDLQDVCIACASMNDFFRTKITFSVEKCNIAHFMLPFIVPIGDIKNIWTFIAATDVPLEITEKNYHTFII